MALSSRPVVPILLPLAYPLVAYFHELHPFILALLLVTVIVDVIYLFSAVIQCLIAYP